MTREEWMDAAQERVVIVQEENPEILFLPLPALFFHFPDLYSQGRWMGEVVCLGKPDNLWNRGAIMLDSARRATPEEIALNGIEL